MNQDAHFYFDLVSAAAMVGWLIIGLLIRNKISDVRLEIEQHRGVAERGMAALQKEIEVHIAKDEQMFSELFRLMDWIQKDVSKRRGA